MHFYDQNPLRSRFPERFIRIQGDESRMTRLLQNAWERSSSLSYAPIFIEIMIIDTIYLDCTLHRARSSHLPYFFLSLRPLHDSLFLNILTSCQLNASTFYPKKTGELIQKNVNNQRQEFPIPAPAPAPSQ